MTDKRENLIEPLSEYFGIGDSYAHNLKRVKTAFDVGTMSLEDFEEFDEETVEDIANHLIANGVTVQEWIPVSEPPKEDGRYQVYKKSYIGEYAYDVLSFAKDGRKIDPYDFEDNWKNVWYHYNSEYGYLTTNSVTYWMPLPEPPKGD